jgi:glycosyltransferase involved in cell wall biosynthesis
VRICLIGATHVSQNPRLLREADSLSEAGHDVCVVAPSFIPVLVAQDNRHLARRQWQYRAVDYQPAGVFGKMRSISVRGKRRLAYDLFQKMKLPLLCEPGYTPALKSLITAASAEPADWVIAHAHPALPVAAAAAKRLNAKLGFDCEDLLAANDPETSDMVFQIEQRYLRDCDYVSVPSACLGRELVKTYGISTPIVLHNVFPLALAQGLDHPAVRTANMKLRIHWFGKTIGSGRGLEDAVEAAGILGDNVELILRGSWAAGFEHQLQTLARRNGVNLIICPPVDHDELVNAMDQFDVGLALERPHHGNYSLALTNKIGSYALAGLAIAATDTPGHREFLDPYPTAGFLYEAGNSRTLADGLGQWLTDKVSLRAAQQASWEAARTEFCWDLEKERFLKLFSNSGTQGDSGEAIVNKSKEQHASDLVEAV